MTTLSKNDGKGNEVTLFSGPVVLKGILSIPEKARGLVLFAHGSGSSRNSPRNQFVASVLQHNRCATLLMDLLTLEEEAEDLYTRHLRFDISLLAERLMGATEWVLKQQNLQNLSLGYFGSSTGAAAALVAAAEKGNLIKAVVSRGGRPDLAASVLEKVLSPTLLIVGGNDRDVIELNKQALAIIKTKKKLEIVPYATHLFEESGTLEHVAELASKWFETYL